MALLGPNNPSNAFTDGTGGLNWNIPGYVFVHDSSRASAEVIDFDSQTTDGLRTTEFGFSIPAGATINGIVAEIERKKSHSTGIAVDDETVSLLKAGFAVGSNYASGVAWSATESYQSYGGPSDLWGTTWSVAEINDPSFGLVLQANLISTSAQLRSAQVNHMRITVYYTLGAGDAAGVNMLAMF